MWYFRVLIEAIMVAVLFCGMSLVYNFAYDFDVSGDAYSKCVVE